MDGWMDEKVKREKVPFSLSPLFLSLHTLLEVGLLSD